MPGIEEYALIGDTQTVALVSRRGSIDWFCAPRFDSDASLAALLGDERHGCWALELDGPVRSTRRAYREGTLVLDTELETGEGTLRVTDCMPARDRDVNITRCFRALRGRVRARLRLAPRFGYGRARPWIRLDGTRATAFAGSESLVLRGPVPLLEEDGGVVARLALDEGEELGFTLDWHPSHQPPAPDRDPRELVRDTERWWRDWAARCTYQGPWREAVVRSLVTLKALTYGPSGGIVAAATTSLPEQLGGARNWDYRLCWIRDATFTLYALVNAGYVDEAARWRDWLLRAVAGEPGAMQTLYGPAGERRLTELELPWLPGYEHSRPVRIGNQASEQLQLDVYGEVLDCLHQARRHGMEPEAEAWRVQRGLLDHLESVWREADAGIWEIRGQRRPFTHSKVMAWVAFDRAVKDASRHQLPGPVDRWAGLRDAIHAEVCREGWSSARGSFVQSYGSREVDAALLLIPLVGFLPPGDPRVRATVTAVERDLVEDGLVRRYRTTRELDGLPPGEALFLPCSFWLADCYTLLGRAAEARALLERLLSLRNDVGLLSEEYDPGARRLVGNFPQAITHVALVNTVGNLARGGGAAAHRSGAAPPADP
jgi:GH15 family glucan-1,4-alpha-glucosidase